MQKNPKVSVILPAYNAEKYIAETIESILNQTYKDFEFIIVNDCSTDSTKEIIENFAKQDKRIRLVSNDRNLKVSKTANKGIELANGEYIARTDSDDWSYPDRLEKQLKFMESNPEVVLLSGNMEICDATLNIKNQTHFPTTNDEIIKVILQYNPTVHSAMMFKKETFKNVGGYGGINSSEDYLLLMKMASKGKIANLDDVLIKYRVLNTSLTSKNKTEMHLATLYCQLDGRLNYKYPLTFKTKLIHLARLFIAYFVPSFIWRFISTILRK
jgi:glycosyltransferase involved in cell wall biosynthesis